MKKKKCDPTERLMYQEKLEAVGLALYKVHV